MRTTSSSFIIVAAARDRHRRKVWTQPEQPMTAYSGKVPHLGSAARLEARDLTKWSSNVNIRHV